MNDEKMATSMENQTDAVGCDPLPSTCEDAVDAAFSAGDVGQCDDRYAADTSDASLTASEPAAPQKDAQSVQDHLPVGDPLSDPDSDPDAAFALPAQEQLGMLQCELKQLREELTAMKETRENFRRMTDELREFHDLYPEVSLKEIPDEVYDSMYAGIPPAAGYALYLKREREKQKEADRINGANLRRSSGSLVAADADYYSPGEVRAMSQAEVRKNYQKIMQSMQKWH